MAVVLECYTEQLFAQLTEAQDALTYMETELAPFLIDQLEPWRISDRFASRGHYATIGRVVVAVKQSQDQIRGIIQNEWTANGAAHPLRLALPGSFVVTSENRASEGSNYDQDIQRIVRG